MKVISVEKDRDHKLAQVAKEFEKLQKEQLKNTQALKKRVGSLEKNTKPTHNARSKLDTGIKKPAAGGGNAAGAAEAAAAELAAKRELNQIKKDFTKKLADAEKKIETLEKKLKNIGGNNEAQKKQAEELEAQLKQALKQNKTL